VELKLFTCQSECAFPIKSTYNRVDRRPVGLLETKKPFPSADQSKEVKLFQFFTVISRVGRPDSEINRILLSLALTVTAAIVVPSGESPEAQPFADFSSFATSCAVSRTDQFYCTIIAIRTDSSDRASLPSRHPGTSAAPPDPLPSMSLDDLSFPKTQKTGQTALLR
jgi:hypothetical protein